MMEDRLLPGEGAEPAATNEPSPARIDDASPRGRVLFVTSSYPRWEGDSTTPFVLQLAQDLQRLGWNVRVLAPHAPGARIRERLHEIDVTRFRYLWPEWAQTVCYGGGALINLRRHRWNYAKLPALVASQFAHVTAMLAGHDFDIVHSHWLLPQSLVAGVASAITGVPHIATVHGGDAFALRGRLMRRLKGMAIGLADVVTVNSSATLEVIRGLAPSHGSVVRVPIGASQPSDDCLAEALDIRARYRAGGGPLLVFVGRLVDEKGVGDLIRAVAILARRRPDVRALIVGDGQQRGEFEALATGLGLSRRVSFTGWIEPSHIASYLAAGDAFVGPSKRSPDGWLEGQGLTFVEAMLAGTPVIATNCGGIVDIVKDQDTGLVVSEGDPVGIAAAVERTIDDIALRSQIVANALAAARAEFTRPACAMRFSALYGRLKAGRRRAATGSTERRQ